MAQGKVETQQFKFKTRVSRNTNLLFYFLVLVLISSRKKITSKRTRDLTFFVHYYSAFPFFVVPFLVYFDADPIAQFHLKITLMSAANRNFLIYLTIRVVSFILLSVTIFEASRFISGLIPILTIGTRLIVDCILHLDKIFMHWRCIRFNEILRWNEILHIILQSVYEVSSSTIILAC